ncbi:MAG: hypothetical protein VZQ29_12000, partial [Succiniclasticum sp.]|nr:hypothetical protein [Succiniclasticum sp.]
ILNDQSFPVFLFSDAFFHKSDMRRHPDAQCRFSVISSRKSGRNRRKRLIQYKQQPEKGGKRNAAF